MIKKKILVIDDEPNILSLLSYSLTNKDYQVTTANNSWEAKEILKNNIPDLIILDIMMPGESGLELSKWLHNHSTFKKIPLMFLTAKNDDDTHIKGLSIGAVDFISKPMSIKVIITRIQHFFKREATHNPIDTSTSLIPLVFTSLRINPATYTVYIKKKEVILAKKEFELLYMLASKPQQIFNRQEILQTVWGEDIFVGERTIDVHIRRIRSKLSTNCIKTIKGVGYRCTLS